MVEQKSEANGALPETTQSGEPAKAKTPVATMTDALPDDQLDISAGGAYPLTYTGAINTGIGG
ncbi:hypothetical protein [uncultured Bradyrhizobium sp.]|jgi:hypothetical protein|uniref:hypothetical protein n=1 Tax=uncultured Bradyrhizobium sp. TaxID=199684 RepID=UPI00262E774F|nr:hypothetical protein [uncultured Bradyrhizobium sp.]